MSSLADADSDTLVIAKRSLLRIPRQPDLLLAFTVQPVMFVLLFRYVFGGAIRPRATSYVDFLIPGIIVQTIVLRRVRHRGRALRGPPAGPDRPFPLAADGALGGARGRTSPTSPRTSVAA